MLRRTVTAVLTALLLFAGPNIMATAQENDAPGFGSAADVDFSQQLWQQLRLAKLVGADAINSKPYEGSEPHGVVLTTLESTLAVDGRKGTVIVKHNYVGENVTVDSVADNPTANLGAITVMFQREAGYDPEVRDWFWAKFKKDGTLFTNPRGLKLAGKVAKNPEGGCIACHVAAPGDDFVFFNNQLAVREAK